MSSSVNSRRKTTRLAPRSRAQFTADVSVQVICVNACQSISGAIVAHSRATPGSWTITASTPAFAHARIVCSTASSSWSNTRVFGATCPLYPSLVQEAKGFGQVLLVEVFRPCARIERLQSEVDRIGTRPHGGLHRGSVAGGCQNFRSQAHGHAN